MANAKIDWFPGHMVTARKEAVETMRKTDVVIEVLDARVPLSSCNPMIEGLRQENQRPALKILNKADVADPELTRQWLAHYNALPGVKAIALSAKKAGEVSRIPKECLELAPSRSSAAKPLRMMILGIPNVGKSTLMNSLLKRNVAKVGDEPAVTKMQMRHDLGRHMWIIDTPGMLWPNVGQAAALKLAATHSIGRNAYDDENVAVALGDYLLGAYRGLLVKRFDVPAEVTTGHELLTAVARRRGFVIKGGEVDVSKAALALLNDFRSGALGRITLEKP